MRAHAPHEVAFAIRGPIACADLPGLCDRVCAALGTSNGGVVLCSVGGVAPDAVTVDALARLQLAARRHGCQVRLRDTSDELLALVDFMGLHDVLPGAGDEFSSSRPSTERADDPGGTMSATTSRKIFVNLAVKGLDKSVEFFGKLGFEFDSRFTDESATCMIVSDEAFVMLLVEDRFSDFTTKQLVDPTTHTEAIVALSAESREEVDELADKALAAGGSRANDPIDMGFMYGRSFQDPDGHIWELVWMDPSAIERGAEAEAGAELRVQ